MAPITENSTSSSEKKRSSKGRKSHHPHAGEGEEEEDEEEGDDEPVKTVPVGDKLTVQHLANFGFNLAEEVKREGGGLVDTSKGGGAALAKAIAAKNASSRNQTNVVYGGDTDSIGSDFNDDFDDQGYIGQGDSDEDDDEEEEEEAYLVERPSDKPGHNYLDDYMADDMWEDEDDEEEDEDEEEGDEEEWNRLQQEAYEAAMLAEEEERERQRDVRLAEIRKKKEVLIERYLRVARVMITHRKKNIYLQDYLYHLAFRKGVLRGDRGDDAGEAESEILQKAAKKRQRRKNSTMAARFARFLRKTGNYYDDDRDDKAHHHHHNRNEALERRMHQQKQMRHHQKHQHQHHHGRHNYSSHVSQFRRTLGATYSRPDMPSNKHHHHRRNLVPTTVVRKFNKNCPGVEEGKECPMSRKTRWKLRQYRKHLGRQQYNHSSLKSSTSKTTSSTLIRQKPKTLAEILEAKAQALGARAARTADEALDAFERHRCQMAKKKQLIRITKLLERLYSGTSLLDPERSHLVKFVESSVKAQSLAKKKALRRQQRNQEKKTQKMGTVNMNHQWIKSLDRIRELRLKKAKLEQEHRLVLLRKVKHWHVWEKRDATAVEAVHDFVSNLASRVNMSRMETYLFKQSFEQFQKQLYTLHQAMMSQVIKMYKAQHTLCLAQRRVKDNASVAAPMMKGLSISDFERMSIENQESHQKLMERQEHLKEQYEKLKRYVKNVAESHHAKQGSYGALRAGRHDMKQLWELCNAKRNDLMDKLNEIQKVENLHRRLFMQISVLENKHLYKDYKEVERRVSGLKDIERNLLTQLHQAQSCLRVLNVRMGDTESRMRQERKMEHDKRLQKKMKFSKDTIKERIEPKVPNTIHAVNILSQKSQMRVVQEERRRSSTPTRNNFPKQVTIQPTKSGLSTSTTKSKVKLPKVRK